MVPWLEITNRPIWLIALVIAAGALAWGAIEGTRPIPPRPPLPQVPADSAWYGALPKDPELATQAYLARFSPELRAVGRARETTVIEAFGGQLVALTAAFGLVALQLRRRTRRSTVDTLPQRVVRDGRSAAEFLTLAFLLGLPVQVYAGFIHNRSQGFYLGSFGTWLHDTVLGWLILMLFTITGLVLTLQLIRRSPFRWPIHATFIYAALVLTYNFILPSYIEPLFNTLTPLSDGQAKAQILSMARASGVPATDVFIQDASRQSALIDAHVSGVAGHARIVFDDNTIVRTPLSTVRAVAGHEIGHYVLGHTLQIVLFQSLLALCGFVGIAIVLRRFDPDAATPRDTRPWLVPIFWWTFGVWGTATLPLINSFYRALEHQADLFGFNAAQEPLGFADLFVLNADAGNPTPSWLVEVTFHSHPSAAHRIHDAMVWRAEQP